MTFRKGLDHVQASIERGNARKGGTGRRYFKWEAGEEKTLRFLTEGSDIVLASVHEFVTCLDGTKRSFVCRAEIREECELCSDPDIRKREVGFAVAVWREPVKQDGKVVFVDKTEQIEVEENGQKVTKTVPWVGVIQQAPRNFWSFFWAAYDKYGTLRDRDYSVTRRGSGMETSYTAFQEDPVEIAHIEDRYANYTPDLEEMLSRLSSMEYYDKFLRGIEAESNADKDLNSLKKANENLRNTAATGVYE